MLAGNATNSLDPYRNLLVMPLADFIEHPLAHELVHNGQALQVKAIKCQESMFMIAMFYR